MSTSIDTSFTTCDNKSCKEVTSMPTKGMIWVNGNIPVCSLKCFGELRDRMEGSNVSLDSLLIPSAIRSSFETNNGAFHLSPETIVRFR